MTQQSTTASVKVDGDKLAEALRRVSPFMGEKDRPNIAGVYAESQGGTLQLTTTDGFRMAHLTLALPFPEGNYLMKADGVKDFSQLHYNGQEIEVAVGQGDEQDTLKLGDVIVELETTPYPDYTRLIPQDFDLEAIVDTRAWIKPIRQHKPEVVGVVYSASGCRAYYRNFEGETVVCESLPVQMIAGPDKKVAYHGERLRKALTSCGPSATIEVGNPAKATLFQSEDYWHLLMPMEGFPREVSLTSAGREVLKWAEEALQAVRRGEVAGRVLMGGGKFYLELLPGDAQTEIRVQEPSLAEPAPEQPTAEAAADKPETTEEE